jgi:ribosome-binding factor A
VPIHEGKRAIKVAQLLQEELALMILQELRDPRVNFITVTDVVLSPDLRNARVYVSVLAGQQTNTQVEERALVALKAASGFLRRACGQRLQLRYAPQLRFLLDQTAQQAERLQYLLTPQAKDEVDFASHSTSDLPEPLSGKILLTQPSVKMPQNTRKKQIGKNRLYRKHKKKTGHF